MTKERKTNLLALIMVCIVCILAAGCATKRKAMAETTAKEESSSKVEQEKDTTIVETHDTTKVSQRLVPIEVEIPAASKERTTTDTTSVLETDLYKSTATWSNGKLKHTLEAKPGAKVKGQTAVSDTTRTSTKNEKSKNTRNTSTDSKSQQKDTQEVKTTTKQASWSEWLTTGIIIGTTATIAIIWRWKKRKRTKTQQA